jgi:tetratricopeptide (TPR) repeat protein
VNVRNSAFATRIAPLALALLLAHPDRSGAETGLTEAPLLARVYDAILDADADRFAREMKRACGPAPPVACALLDASAVWWQIQMDPDSRALDPVFLAKLNASVQGAEAWTAREPDRAEAWFYRGAAYGVRVQYRVLRNEKLAAARDGKRIKDSLERALTLDPGLEDAHFGIGLYKYYADIVPTALKLLRWLLLLPGGDRVRGLSEMLQARDRGALLRGEADYQIHLIYLWYEHKPTEAIALLQGLSTRHPHNPLFPLHIAEVLDVYLHDHAASLAVYRGVLQEARQHRVTFGATAEARARLGAARELDALYETDVAIEQLTAVVALRPTSPYGALADAHLALGHAYDRLGQRTLAVASYQTAAQAAPADDPAGVRLRAAEGLRRRPDARAAEAYRLSLEGLRAIERGALAEAEAALDRSSALRPGDPVTGFRYARLFEARGDRAQALHAYEQTIAARPAAPPTILAAAYVGAGRMLEHSGQRARAIDMYRAALGVAGIDLDTRDAAVKSLARLGSPTTPHQ